MEFEAGSAVKDLLTHRRSRMGEVHCRTLRTEFQRDERDTLLNAILAPRLTSVGTSLSVRPSPYSPFSIGKLALGLISLRSQTC